MIQTILQKCLDELSKEKPDLSYIRGMLEVLLASQPTVRPILGSTDAAVVASAILAQKSFTPTPAQMAQNAAEKPTDEASILDAKAKAAMASVMKMNEEMSK